MSPAPSSPAPSIMDALGYINMLFTYLKGGAVNANNTDDCPHRLVEEQRFYQIALVPAFLIVVGLSFTQTRRSWLKDVLGGRPGLVSPMELSARTNRASYACAFGSTVYLITQVVYDNFQILHYDGALVLQTVIVLTSVLVFGLVYLPVFLCLTLGSVYGYVAGSVYTWMLTGVQVVRMLQCDYNGHTRVVVILRNMPVLLCLLYLSCSLPRRTYLICKRKYFGFGNPEKQFLDVSLDHLRRSYYGRRVILLLKNKWQQDDSIEPAVSRIKVFTNFIQDHTYRHNPDFRYSARVLCTLTVALMVMYSLVFELLVLLVTVYEAVYHWVLVDWVHSPEARKMNATELRDAVDGITLVFDYTIVPVITSTSFAAMFGVYGIIRMLTGYRRTLYKLYRGELKDLTKDMDKCSLLLGSLRYSGYQVAYVSWGLIIHTLFLTVICYIVAIFVFLIQIGVTDWIIQLLNLWPIPVWAIVINVSQTVLTKYAFLQDNGQLLAFNNRRLLFIFSYFTFFYNVFLGLFSTFLRLIKGAVIGAVMLPRLDYSTLPAAFSQFDPGYRAYLGFIKVEESQSHPVMLAFIRLLMLLSRQRRAALGAQDIKDNMCDKDGVGNDDGEGPEVVVEHQDMLVDARKSPKARAATFTWHLAYTLINNPDLRLERKGYVQTMRRARELGVRVPKSDGFVMLDPALLQEFEEEQRKANEGLMEKAGGKLVGFKFNVRTKVRKAVEHMRRDSEIEMEEPQIVPGKHA